ncbi:MAG TPA: penicillin-binding protein 2 [Thermoanaerobaculia bacterium]|nr:penicillin-binding protein 2 [Thermoanaerobaculia bacterium]
MRVYRDDQKALNLRINIVMWGCAAVFFFLAGSFWYVQAVQADKYRTLSETNALRETPVRARRGLIKDRNGKILADNQAAYTLNLNRVDLNAMAKTDPAIKERIVNFVANTLTLPPAEVLARLDRGKNIPVSQPLVLEDDLTMPQIAGIEANKLVFPPLTVEPVQRRNYRYGVMAAHVLGYMGEATEKDMAKHSGLKLGDLIGKKSVELVYDDYLRGLDGAKFTIVDSRGRTLDEYREARKNPVAGRNLYLTLDFELQRRAEQYFIENEFVGAAVAMDPKTGEVMMMVSSPTYNPNVFSKRFTPDIWRSITSNPFHLLQNRAIQGLYSPGSVFKVVMAMAGLSYGAVTPSTTFDCGGSGTFFGRRFRCWNKNGHGTVSVATAIKVSCDIFFYNTGARLGVDKIAEYAHRLSFGELTGIDLEGENPGLVPTEEWARVKQHRKWYPSETISVAIGQGPLTVTVLQVATMMSAIANGGTVYQPHVVKMIETTTSDGTPTGKIVIKPKVRHEVKLSEAALASVRTGLWKVVNEDGGTGANARITGLDVSGKTGTVQVVAQSGYGVGLPFKYKDHAWFASFAPKDNPRLVVVVFVEHGGHGGTDAAPLARAIYEGYFHDTVEQVNLNLGDPETLEKIKEGQIPTPGLRIKAPAQNAVPQDH